MYIEREKTKGRIGENEQKQRGDRNGVVVIRRLEAEAVMARAMEKRVRQEAVIKRMKETGKIIPRIPGKL